MAHDIDPFKLSSPRIFLVRMLVFLILCSLVVVVLYRQIWTAFLANPGLNALIIGVLLIGIALAFRQVIRLFPEVNWVNGFRLADPGLAVERPPVLLAPMAAAIVATPTVITVATRTPDKMTPVAKGSSTCRRTCRSVMPMARAASRTPGSTPIIPV